MKEKTLIAFGLGDSFYSYYKRLSKKLRIPYVSDNDNEKIRGYSNKKLKALSPDRIKTLNQPLVIIMTDVPKNIREIRKQFENDNIETVTAKDLLNIICNYNESPYKGDNLTIKIHKFIDLHLDGTNICNFHCSYCSVWRRTGSGTKNDSIDHSVAELRKGLSRKKLGGFCYINICARGETLLSDKIVDITKELLAEGHLVSIVTNGTVTSRIKEITDFPKELQKRMSFKISFHYIQLMKRNMMEVFWDNVKTIKNSECSYSIEITPDDEAISHLDEIKAIFDDKADGAMPHITFTRDSKKEGLDLFSEYDLESYKKIWGQFESKMFDLKQRWYNKKMNDTYCMAGQWSYLVDADTGNIRPCYGYGPIGNIYDQAAFPVKPIGFECRKPYCFNNHVYVALGCQPDIRDYTYSDMRDKVDREGRHWLKETVRQAYSQKLYDNNYTDSQYWDDYNRLMNREDKSAVILFNSPDYPNLGDQAIAFCTKKFFDKYFPERGFYEVSCTEYEKESDAVASRISPEDIIVINGGGNIDSLHLRLLDMTESIISRFPENQIMIFPQTLFFEDTEFGKIEEERFRNCLINHGKIGLLVREEKSFVLASKLFESSSVDVKQTLDMALSLDYAHKIKQRRGICLCFRDDREMTEEHGSSIREQLQRKGIDYSEISTILSDRVTMNNREEKLSLFLDEIAGTKLVVTDRLHCMIFCAITATPCIVMNNTTGKVKGVYDQISYLSYLRYIESVNDFEAAFKKLININTSEFTGEIIHNEDKRELVEWVNKRL